MEPSKKSRGGSPGNSDRNVNEFVTANKSRTVTAHEIFNNNNTCIYSIDFKVTPHLLRHTCITNWIYAGADIKTVQDFAGHADPTTTLKIYAHVKNKDAESKYKAAEEIYKNLENKGILLYNNT